MGFTIITLEFIPSSEFCFHILSVVPRGNNCKCSDKGVSMHIEIHA